MFVSDGQSFHPKSYILSDATDSGVAYVGSSNLSGSALLHGVEWNFRVIASRDRVGFDKVREAFESLFRHPKTRKIDIEWLREYRGHRRPPVTRTDAVSDAAPEPALQIPEPNAIQRQALKALDETRTRGFKAGLVVLPTGLPQDVASAFDSNRARVQARAVRGASRGDSRAGDHDVSPGATSSAARPLHRGKAGPNADVLFASIQTLGRQAHLGQFARDAFDYVVVMSSTTPPHRPIGS